MKKLALIFSFILFTSSFASATWVAKDNATIDGLVTAGFGALTAQRCKEIGTTVKNTLCTNHDVLHDILTTSGATADERNFAATLFVVGPPCSNGAGGETGSATNLTAKSRVFVDKSGGDGTGKRERFDRPFLTISAATTVAVAGDTIAVGPGTYVENSGVVLAPNVSLIGAGMTTTVIQSTAHNVVSANTNSLLRDFTAEATLSDGTFQTPVANDPAATGIVIQNVKVTGDADGFLLVGPTAGSVFARLFNCVADSKYDCLNSSKGDVECYNCSFRSQGPSVAGNISVAVAASGTSGSVYARVFFYGGSVYADGATNRNAAFETRGFGTSGMIEAHNVRIKRGTSASSNYDLNGSSSGNPIYYNNVVRDDGAPLVTNNTTIMLTNTMPKTYTVATLPTASSSTGRVANVSDGDSSLAWGATVVNSGSGAVSYLVRSNGTNWTVAGK